MTDIEQREAARQFFYKWNGKGKEDEDARSYWIDFLQDILGVDRVTDRVDFEKKVVGRDGNTKRIDVYIPETRVLIEQKSLGIALDKPQAGHKGKTPFGQALEYDDCLPFEEKSRWIITSNFSEIWIYDMNIKPPKPVVVMLDELLTKYHQFDFLVNKEAKRITEEMKLSLEAGSLVGNIYDAFLKQYKNPENPDSLKSLNKLCVRLVFCLFAEDAGLFDKHLMFHDYLEQYRTKDMRKALIDLFEVLNTPYEQRDPYLDETIAAFPYVNGGLFEDEKIEIPQFTDEIRNLLLEDASAGFNWSDISPTIFGAVFESTLNPDLRRSGGMHYTSIADIHKVIDPLFLDGLKAEFEEIKKAPTTGGSRTKRLQAFQKRLASLTFLDPAAGSGNFLTESYLSLRRMENEVIRMLTGLMEGQMMLDDVGNETIGVKVSISQFYGIEINDFAVAVAKTAMWIAEAQMLRDTKSALTISQDFLPLKTNVNIVEGNALTKDWESVVPKSKLNYIMGNNWSRDVSHRCAA
ncbi:MAG: class I SAM-dependent DNA methyltransferase [Anaerolineaceae bacterium]|nr:class I SAM-dependent DNA methyltransferase [Anaerolineaceae bacterium]